MPGPACPRANKRLGQHFLIDQNIVRKIVAAAELTPDDTVLEVGPGRGILTEALASVVRRVVAVEIDPQLHRLLQARQSEWKNVEVVCADATLQTVIDTILRSAQTGQIGDGKIFVTSLDDSIRIRTGETGEDAL